MGTVGAGGLLSGRSYRVGQNILVVGLDQDFVRGQEDVPQLLVQVRAAETKVPVFSRDFPLKEEDPSSRSLDSSGGSVLYQVSLGLYDQDRLSRGPVPKHRLQGKGIGGGRTREGFSSTTADDRGPPAKAIHASLLDDAHTHLRLNSRKDSTEDLVSVAVVGKTVGLNRGAVYVSDLTGPCPMNQTRSSFLKLLEGVRDLYFANRKLQDDAPKSCGCRDCWSGC